MVSSFSTVVRILSIIGICFITACAHRSVGYINPGKLVEGYHGSVPRKAALMTQAKIWQANLDSLSAELTAVPAAEKEAKEQEFLRYRGALQQKAQEQEARVQQEILGEINAYIKQYGKAQEYDFILGATDQGNIVYAADGTELTEVILQGLNQQYDKAHPAGQ
jgi:outer membrane protein